MLGGNYHSCFLGRSVIHRFTFHRLFSSSNYIYKNPYYFYDLVKNTPRAPMSFVGSSELKGTAEERARTIFGSKLDAKHPEFKKNTDPHLQYKVAGVTVPPRPIEPDNCCMSGCINCVWETFKEELEYWQSQRREAAIAFIKQGGGQWPIGLDMPASFRKQIEAINRGAKPIDVPPEVVEDKDAKDDPWEDFDVNIRVFVETEKRLREEKQRKKLAAKKSSATEIPPSNSTSSDIRAEA